MTRCPTCLQPIPTKAQKDRKKARQDRYRTKMKKLVDLARQGIK